jgi:outer membrane receptor protein involved in Fe transport
VGVFADSVKNEVEPYATVRLFREGQMDRPVGMSLTGEQGEISQAVSAPGRYLLVISAVGKQDARRLITVKGESELPLGKVFTADASTDLSTVEVVAQKPVVRMETDKMTYNVQGDADAQSLTLLDLLRKVPMVTVDAQDNITVKGSSSFKVLVDGKPNVQMQANAKQIFKAMPASMVEKVEVLTNPGAKFDAEGVGGVLNLVLRHEGGQGANVSANGFSGEVAARVNNMVKAGSLNLSGQHRKWSYTFNGYGGYSHIDPMDMETERRDVGIIHADALRIQSESDMRTTFAGSSLGLGYELDSLNMFNASVGFNYYRNKADGTATTALTRGYTGKTFTYDYESNDRDRSLGITASADWQHFFNRERTHNFTLSYQFSNSPRRQQNRRFYGPVEAGSFMTLDDSYSDSHTSAAEHTLQADYTLPLAQGQTLNTGAKYISRRNHADADYYLREEADPTTTLDYRNHQQIVAGYVEHSASSGKWSTREGLRYEHTWEKIDYPTMAEQNFHKNYGNLVPSATVSYQLGDATNLGLTYSLRILRPGISYMNPYRNESDPTAVTYGNPDLKVEKAHYIDLVFNHYVQKFMINATLSQSFCNNQIASYSFTDAQGRLNTTYSNSVKNRWTNLNTWMRFVASSKTSVMLNGYLGYGDIRSQQLDAHNSGWQASAVLMLDQQLPWKVKSTLGMQTSTRTYNIQGYQSGMSIAYLMLNRAFVGERLNVSVFAMTPMASKLRIKSYTLTSSVENISRVAFSLQTLQLSVSWKFGNAKRQFSQHQSKINNNFGESQSQGQQISTMGAGK